MALGRLADARGTMNAALRRYPQMIEIQVIDLNLRYLEGDTTVRQRLAGIAGAVRSGSDRVAIAGLLIPTALAEGKLREASRLRAEVAPHARARVGSPVLLDVNFRLDSIEANARLARRNVTADLQRVVRSADFARIPQQERPYLRMAVIAALTGNTAFAREMLRAWEAHADEIQRTREGEQLTGTRVALEFAEGRYSTAVAQIGNMPAGDCPTCRLPWLGLVYDSAGVADSTIAAYERYLVSTGAFRMGTDGWFKAPLHERLGELYERRGDRARALAHYTSFVEQWENADPELQPRVRAARAAIARLQRSS
jgi:tetratricopeptide (TPR) repeat protein